MYFRGRAFSRDSRLQPTLFFNNLDCFFWNVALGLCWIKFHLHFTFHMHEFILYKALTIKQNQKQQQKGGFQQRPMVGGRVFPSHAGSAMLNSGELRSPKGSYFSSSKGWSKTSPIMSLGKKLRQRDRTQGQLEREWWQIPQEASDKAGGSCKQAGELLSSIHFAEWMRGKSPLLRQKPKIVQNLR